MHKNQTNKVFLEFLTNSGVNYFTQNQPNNFYTIKENNKSNDLNDINSIEDLKKYINKSNICQLSKTAKNTVFSDGNKYSKLMIVGEAPGKEEDVQGIPFVGKAGILLNKMLLAINLKREDVYITNVIPWRPPNNRTPNNDEIMECLPILQKHIEIIKPSYLFLLGGTAAKAILASPLSVSKLRNIWHTYNSIYLKKNIKTLVSYHPAFLLRSPQFKKEAWNDLKILQKEINSNAN